MKFRRTCGFVIVAWLWMGATAYAQPDDGDEQTDESSEAERSTDEGDDAGDEASDEASSADDEEDDAAKPEPKPEPPREQSAAAEASVDTKPAESEADEGPSWREQLNWRMGPVHLAPVVLIQTQVVPYTGDDSLYQAGDIAERPGFRLRRARFGFDGGHTDQARLRITGELAAREQAELRIHDAWLGYTPFSFLGVYAGAQKMPISRYAQISSGGSALVERPLMTRAMVPGHQVGLALRGDVADGAFGYAIGAFNGLQREGLFYEGWVENYAALGNRFDGLAYAARVTTEPLGALPSRAADEQQGPLRFGLGANYFFSNGGARDVHTAGGDAHLMVRGFHLLLEGLYSQSIPESVPDLPSDLIVEVTSFGFVAEAGYMILPRMLGLAARFELIEPNADSDDESDNWLIGGGVQLQVVEQLLKLQVDFFHREEMFGTSLENDTLTLQLQLFLDPANHAAAAQPVSEATPPEPQE
jgi:hypothetical protein